MMTGTDGLLRHPALLRRLDLGVLDQGPIASPRSSKTLGLGRCSLGHSRCGFRAIFESAAHWAKDQLDTWIQKWFRYDNPGGSLVTCYLESPAPILHCNSSSRAEEFPRRL
jgi:hypothetical protein